jgi:hypothetical protein
MPLKIKEDVTSRSLRLRKTLITFPSGELSANDRKALNKLIKAADLMNEIYLQQVSPHNTDIRETLRLAKDGLSREALHYFNINFGPWDRLSGNQPFIGEKTKPPGAGFYPEDITKDEFQKWIERHPEDKPPFTNLYTVIRRKGQRLVAIPYSQGYREFLDPAAKLLKEAAEIVENDSLQKFLQGRAKAFLTDDYYESDINWMDLDSSLEVTIGPYEVYEDGLFGYKAAFEAFITVNDPMESAKLQRYASLLPQMELNLPIPEKHKNTQRGTESPIRVVNEICTGGDARKGIQVSAFNLPNDERVRETKGSKKILLKNVMEAKFNSCLQPVASRLISKNQLNLVTFQAYFNEVLFHELSHGLGPGIIVKSDGNKTEVRMELKEFYSSIEEAKADVVGLWNILYMIDAESIDRRTEHEEYVTFVAGLFRAARFGLHEAHGLGVVSQFNFLREKGVILPDSGQHMVRLDLMKDAIRDLANQLLMIEAEGSYTKAREFLQRFGKVPDELRDALKKVEDLPIDIEPDYEVLKLIDRN